MQIFSEIVFGNQAVHRNSDKGRPHVYEIKTVKAMRYNEHKRREGSRACACSADKQDERAGKSAYSRVEKRTRQTSEREIVGHEL